MSGIDEQRRDVVPCGCEKYRYWTMFEGDIRDSAHLLGYLNPDSWLDKGYRMSVNKFDIADSLSKDDFVNRIGIFYCEFCEREVKKGDRMFEKLCSDVRMRWNIGNVGDR